MKKQAAISLAMIALFAQGSLVAQTTSYSDVVGYEKKSFVAGTTGHGVGLVQAAKYSGQATSTTSGSIVVSSAPFTAAAFAPVGGLPSHYIQITSGPQAGLVVDITSNTGTTLSVHSGDLASVTGTPTFVVRPHVKVSSLFNGNTDLGDYSDTVTLYNADGSSTTLLRDSGQTTGWLDSTTFAAADAVIYPGQAFLLSTSSSGTFTATGTVNPSQTIVPIYSGLVNLISLSNPSNGKNIQQIGLGTNLSDYADTVGTFSSDGQLQQDASLLWTVSDGFLDATTFSPAVGVNAGGTAALIVNASSNTSWVQPSPLAP